MTSTTETGLTNAVRINCSVSQKIYGRPIFESVTLSDEAVAALMRPSALKSHSSQIARRIGTALRAYLEPQNENPSGVSMTWTYAVYLHERCELTTQEDLDNWGSPPEYWSMNAGDAYVIREDGKPLCPKFLEALCVWCYHELLPKIATVNEGLHTVPVDNRKDVLALITKKNFEACRERFEKEGRVADYVWDSSDEMMEELLRKSKAEKRGKKKTQG
ncbi:hypothetical protein KCU95_g3203, partial [Aureobasidium melanogenum]